PDIYTVSLHDALPISPEAGGHSRCCRRIRPTPTATTAQYCRSAPSLEHADRRPCRSDGEGGRSSRSCRFKLECISQPLPSVRGQDRKSTRLNSSHVKI